MRFSDRIDRAAEAWGAWLAIHHPNAARRMARDASAKTAFQAGFHMGVKVGETHIDRDTPRQVAETTPDVS